MKKSFIIAIAFSCMGMASCLSETERNEKKMKKVVEESIREDAFKQNATANIIEFQSFGYEVKDENFIDSARIVRNEENMVYFSELQGELFNEIKEKSRKYRLYCGMFGSQDNLSQIVKEELDDLKKDFNKITDSLNYYIERDSLLRKNIEDRKIPKPVYLFKTYIKMTVKDDKTDESENFSDTRYYLFNDELKLIKDL